MTYQNTRGRVDEGQYEAKVPPAIDTKSLLEKLTAAFTKLRKTDGKRDS